MFLVKATRNRVDGIWVCPLGAVRLPIICLTLLTLKMKSSRRLELYSAGVSGR
jgi:hypothetical protein